MIDWVLFLPSVAMQGGPEPWTLFDRHAPVRPEDPDAVTSAIAGFAGHLVLNSFRRSPPGLPTLRSFQAAQGSECLRWLGRRTGWR